jgi:hypothetical protein
VRAVDCAHFAPPTQRTRRDGLVHDRSVLLSVARGGNDYAFAPPAAPFSRTDLLCIIVMEKTPRFEGLRFESKHTQTAAHFV